jgi:excisionase family DNA binding protein
MSNSLSIGDVASFHGVTVLTVRDLVSFGSLPAYKIPGGLQLRFHADDLEGVVKPVVSPKSVTR